MYTWMGCLVIYMWGREGEVSVSMSVLGWVLFGSVYVGGWSCVCEGGGYELRISMESL